MTTTRGEWRWRALRAPCPQTPLRPLWRLGSRRLAQVCAPAGPGAGCGQARGLGGMAPLVRGAGVCGRLRRGAPQRSLCGGVRRRPSPCPPSPVHHPRHALPGDRLGTLWFKWQLPAASPLGVVFSLTVAGTPVGVEGGCDSVVGVTAYADPSGLVPLLARVDAARCAAHACPCTCGPGHSTRPCLGGE